MLHVRRVARLLERLANPDDQSQAPEGVLLYSPNLLRFVAVFIYAIWLLGFINNFLLSDYFNRWFSEEKMTRLFFSQLVLVIIGGIGTGSVVIFARSRYRGCMLGATMLSVSSGMIATAYMYGLNINPHLLIAVTPLLLVGFTVGRDGLVFTAIWIVVTYLFLQLADTWGWWPKPSSISIDVVKHENLSAFVILVGIVLGMQFYLVKIGITLRKQTQLHKDLQSKERYQAELLSRLITAQDEERKRIARDLHDSSLQDVGVVSRALTEMREDIEGMLARCEDLLLSNEIESTSRNGKAWASQHVSDNAQDSPILNSILNEWQIRLGRLLGEDTRMAQLNTKVLDSVSSISTAQQSATEPESGYTGPTLEGVISQVRTISQHLREICDDLHPTYLDDPLANTLQNSAERLQAQNPGVALEISISGEEPDSLRDETKVACKYIMEEAIVNALAHAQPTSIQIRLTFLLEEMILEIADDGTGFDPRPARQLRSLGHHGLSNMEERAQLIGGELVINSRAGAGTCIRLQSVKAA